MPTSEQRIRVVLVSPADVAEERKTTERVINELNRSTFASSRGLALSLWRWETDARPGLHLEGPQGLIDELMDMSSVDLVIGIFWSRFGTATHDAGSGTEHELRSAWASWRESGRPEVMVYFCDRAYAPTSPDEAQQLARVLEFKDQLPREQLWWRYTKPTDFEQLLRNHLFDYALSRTRPGRDLTRETAARRTRRADGADREGARDPRRVAVMHGRDIAARTAVFDLLRRLGLHPMEWDELVGQTGSAAPYSGEVVAVAFEVAQAVVVVLTPDDIGFLHPDLRGARETEDDREPTGQARLNVVLEAGMALQSRPMQTVLVEIGRTRTISDLAGRNTVRLDGGAKAINSLATRLERAGCPVDRGRSDWLDADSFARLDALSRTPPPARPR